MCKTRQYAVTTDNEIYYIILADSFEKCGDGVQFFQDGRMIATFPINIAIVVELPEAQHQADIYIREMVKKKKMKSEVKGVNP